MEIANFIVPDASTSPGLNDLVETSCDGQLIADAVVPVLNTNQPPAPTLKDFQYVEDAIFQYEVPDAQTCFLCSRTKVSVIVIGGYRIRLYKSVTSDGKIVIYGRCSQYRGHKNSQDEYVFKCSYSVTYEERYKGNKVYVVLKMSKNPDHRYHTCEKSLHMKEGEEAIARDIKEEMTKEFKQRAITSGGAVVPEILANEVMNEFVEKYNKGTYVYMYYTDKIIRNHFFTSTIFHRIITRRNINSRDG